MRQAETRQCEASVSRDHWITEAMPNGAQLRANRGAVPIARLPDDVLISVLCRYEVTPWAPVVVFCECNSTGWVPRVPLAGMKWVDEMYELLK
jgi:hypothetical protein